MVAHHKREMIALAFAMFGTLAVMQFRNWNTLDNIPAGILQLMISALVIIFGAFLSLGSRVPEYIPDDHT